MRKSMVRVVVLNNPIGVTMRDNQGVIVSEDEDGYCLVRLREKALFHENLGKTDEGYEILVHTDNLIRSDKQYFFSRKPLDKK